MTERTIMHRAVLALAILAGCTDLDDASNDPRGARYEDPGLIDASLGEAEAAEPPDAGVDAGLPSRDAGVVLKDPKGAYFADVTANGTGCPAGTWTTSIAPDGQSFSTSFSSFEAEVDRRRAISIKDCNLSIKIHSPAGLSYTVEDFFFGGYMYLEPGISARIQSNYYFQGQPDEGAEIVTDIAGPQDKSFLVQDTRERVNVVRSRCGTETVLNARMTLRLRNGNPRGNGYINIWDAPLRGPGDFGLKLSWKRCND